MPNIECAFIINIKEHKSVTICILQVPEKYLSLLTNDKQLYKSCPIEVKRQIWQKNQTLFGDEVLPLLSRYTAVSITLIYFYILIGVLLNIILSLES